MSRIAQTLIFAASIAVIGGCAQVPQDHSQHAGGGAAAQPGGAGHASEMDKRMKAMHEMRDQMAAARTPAERSALMEKRMDMMQSMMEMMMDGKPGPTGK